MQTLQVPGAPVPKDFGPLLTTRERSKGERTFLVSTLVVCGVLALAGLAWALSAPVSKRSQAWAGGLLSIGVAAGCFANVRRMYRSVRFHQNGAVDTCFSKRSDYRYADAVGLTHLLVRQYVNGIYCGTELTFKMDMADGRALKMTLRHKEKPRGLAITILGKTFEGEDEMDVVRDVIASHVANRLTAELTKAGSIGWGPYLRLSPDGIIPQKGPRKGQTVPWRSIRTVAADKGWLFITAEGDTQPFISTICGGHNYYPCMQLFQTFMEAAKGKRVA